MILFQKLFIDGAALIEKKISGSISNCLTSDLKYHMDLS